MRARRILCVLLSCITIISFHCMTARAIKDFEQASYITVTRATGRFNTDIPRNTILKASTNFPLEIGEIVTIKASYSPFSASVDFGLIAPDGLFYSINVKDGSIDKSIKVSQRGNYTFAIRNNSSKMINVSGYINY